MLFDLESLADRNNTTGIITADRYVKAFVGCYEGASGPLCPAKLFEMDGGEFDAMVKSAAARLTYAEDDSGLTLAGKAGDNGLTIADTALMTKARQLAGDANADVVEKALAVFENVMSATGEDRDGDYMHTKGMVVDDHMPLLWMHMQVQPIGAFLGKSQHDDKILKGLFAVAATKLGEDCVTLCELGGLRTSIGFNPVDGQVSPRKTSTVNGRKKVLSWEVKGCNVLEDSVVSVPSCSDAVITALHRNKLHDDYVKHWAKSISDGRPLIIAAGIEMDENGLVTKDTDVEGTKGKEGDCCKGKAEKDKCDKCKKKPKKGGKGDKAGDAENTNNGDADDNGDPNNKAIEAQLIEKGLTVEQAKAIGGLGGDVSSLILSDRVSITPVDDDEQPAALVVKSVEDGLHHKMYGMNDHYLPGSYEWVCYKLDRMAKSFLVGAGVMDADDYGAGVVATFQNEVVLCCGPWDKKRCFQVSYSIDEGGGVKFGGEAVEVEIKAEIMAKWFQVMAKRLALFAEPETEPTAIELARQICAKTVHSDDETLGDALNMTAHAADVFADHDEASLYGELLTAD